MQKSTGKNMNIFFMFYGKYARDYCEIKINVNVYILVLGLC